MHIVSYIRDLNIREPSKLASPFSIDAEDVQTRQICSEDHGVDKLLQFFWQILINRRQFFLKL